MKIAILSGKGGTGKTFISVNMAAVLDNSTYIDCDVEEPNGRIFFKPINVESKAISVSLPQQNKELCTGCRRCVEFCKFNALAFINESLMVFDDVCHSCGGCQMVCPNKAITQRQREIGAIERGFHNNIKVLSGILNTGEASGVPIIKELLSYKDSHDVVIDCPPGCDCSVIESISNADYCVLVSEPTIFGLHNLNMVYELIKLYKLPCGVIINKAVKDNRIIEDYCYKKDLKIIGRLDWDMNVASQLSNGEIIVENNKEYFALFDNIVKTIKSEVRL